MIHAPVRPGWQPLTEIEKRRGHKLLRELADRMECETYSGTTMQASVTHALAHLCHDLYLTRNRTQSDDARCLLIAAFMDQAAYLRSLDEDGEEDQA